MSELLFACRLFMVFNEICFLKVHNVMFLHEIIMHKSLNIYLAK
jgi:hypothetical protein